MTDIVARLRNAYLSTGANYVQEAADEIERLRNCFSAREVRALVDERDRLRHCAIELREIAAATGDPRVHNTMTIEEWVNAQRDEIDRLKSDIASLTDANTRFADRQAWWNDRMYVADQEIERLRDELLMAKDAALEDNEIERLHADNQAAVRAYAAEINEAKAEIERLREDNETLNEIIAIYGNEINRLRVDAERYVWIFSNCEVTYYKNDLPFATEAALDAAMKEKE